MKEFRVIYKMVTIMEAENEEQALELASELGLDDFYFENAEVEEIEEN